MKSTSITFGIAGKDGSSVAWSREADDDVDSPGAISGSPPVVNEVLRLLTLREPIILPTGVRWTFAAEPQVRAADVAAAMMNAIQVDSDLAGLLEMFPELGAGADRAVLTTTVGDESR